MASRVSAQSAAALLLASVFSTVSLVVGADYVTAMLPGGLPFGNLLAASIFCGVAGAATLLAPRAHPARRVAWAALAGSVAWLPVSIALAGNAALNFSGQRGSLWLWLSLGLLVVNLAALAWSAAASFLARRRSRLRTAIRPVPR